MRQFKTYEEKAKFIIDSNKYMVVSTSDKKAKPWGTPVFFAFDSAYNFYFLSAIDSTHAKNIIENSAVSLSIFDSKQEIVTSDSVEIEGKASVVKRDKLEEVIKLYNKRLFPESEVPATQRYNPNSFEEPAEFRFFRVTPVKSYVTGTEGAERRVSIELTE